MFAHVSCAEFPKAAISSTEELRNQAKIADKLDEMSTERTQKDRVMEAIGDVAKQAKNLPAI